VLIAIGNSGDPTLVAEALRLLDDASALIRAMAVWALSRLIGTAELRALAALHATGETDAAVLEEWRAANALPAVSQTP